METILTVLITLGVVSLIGTVWGVIRLNRRVDDLEVARMDIDDELINKHPVFVHFVNIYLEVSISA